MKVLLSGAFGNVGISTLEALVQQGQEICCFDLYTKTNEKLARSYAGKIKVVWGDICRKAGAAGAVADQAPVIHLAAIIPHASSHYQKRRGMTAQKQPDVK